MAKKRSFFERLTGSVSARDEFADQEEKATGQGETWLETQEEEEGELALDVYQTASEVVIQTMVSGVKPEDLQISITREMVTIRGKREMAREINQEDYFQKELYWGAFARTILLPCEVEAEEAEALEKHGLLTIRLPKIDKHREQNLKVKSL